MADINLTTVVVAALGTGGLGAFAREIFTGLGRLARGVSLREVDRRDDLVTAREKAQKRANDAEAERDRAIARAERADRNRWSLEEYVARVRRILISEGRDGLLPAEPAMEQDTITREELLTRRQAIDRERDST